MKDSAPSFRSFLGPAFALLLLSALVLNTSFLLQPRAKKSPASAASSPLLVPDSTNRLLIFESYLGSFWNDLRKVRSPEHKSKAVLLRPSSSTDLILSHRIESTDGKQLYILEYSPALVELLHDLSQASALEQYLPGTLSQFLHSSKIEQASTLSNPPSSASFRSEHNKSFNSLAGCLLALHSMAHLQGYTEKMPLNKPLLESLPAEDYHLLLRSAIAHARDAGFATDPFLQLLPSLPTGSNQPPWAKLLLPPSIHPQDLAKLFSEPLPTSH